MRGNVLKYIFIILIIAITASVIYKTNKNEGNVNNEPVISQQEDETIKEITLGIAEFDTINPILSNNKHVQEISKIIFEPLLKVDEQYKIQKCLAKDWAKTSANTYLIKIRNDIKWSDNTNFSVEDVIYTINILKEIPSIYSNNVQNITNVEKLDEDTIKITLDCEIPLFEYNLVFPIMSQKYFEGYNFDDLSKNSMPIGTGKYKVVQNMSNVIILNKNENYLRDDLTLEKITIYKYATLGELYNAFKLGKIDVITSSNIGIENYIGTIGYNKKEIAGREFNFLAFNTENAVLSNTEVRDAISHAINRENINASFFNNKYKISDYPLDYGSWLKGEQTSNSYDPELAKQILEQNGWEFKYGRWQKTQNYYTRTLNFKIVVQDSNETSVNIAEMIKLNLEDIEIWVTIIKANDNQYQNYLKNKNYDAIIIKNVNSINPNLEQYFGENNYANFYNEELYSIINEIKNISKEELLLQKYNRIRQIFNEEKPYIGLCSDYYIIASSWALRGNIISSWYDIFLDINNWYKN